MRNQKRTGIYGLRQLRCPWEYPLQKVRIQLFHDGDLLLDRMLQQSCPFRAESLHHGTFRFAQEFRYRQAFRCGEIAESASQTEIVVTVAGIHPAVGGTHLFVVLIKLRKEPRKRFLKQIFLNCSLEISNLK